MLSSFSGIGCIPSADIRCPKYCMCHLKKLHFSIFSLSPAALSLPNISSRCSKCSFSVSAVDE